MLILSSLKTAEKLPYFEYQMGTWQHLAKKRG